MTSAARRVLVLLAHPDLRASRANRAILDALQSLQQQWGPQRLEIRDLYACYPDFHIDVESEQAAAEAADLIVWVHPIYWYSMPALMKLWMDEVLTFGWAYGQGGRALHGKDVWLVATTGGAADSYRPQGYNRHGFDAFLVPYEQTAALCGLRWQAPCVLHGALGIDEQSLGLHARRVVQGLIEWAGDGGATARPAAAECPVPATDRPLREA